MISCFGFLCSFNIRLCTHISLYVYTTGSLAVTRGLCALFGLSHDNFFLLLLLLLLCFSFFFFKSRSVHEFTVRRFSGYMRDSTYITYLFLMFSSLYYISMAFVCIAFLFLFFLYLSSSFSCSIDISLWQCSIPLWYSNVYAVIFIFHDFYCCTVIFQPQQKLRHWYWWCSRFGLHPHSIMDDIQLFDLKDTFLCSLIVFVSMVWQNKRLPLCAWYDSFIFAPDKETNGKE